MAVRTIRRARNHVAPREGDDRTPVDRIAEQQAPERLGDRRERPMIREPGERTNASSGTECPAAL
jgi:hypothetical protein